MIAAIKPTIVSQLTVSINSSLMRQAFELLAIAQKKGMEQVSKKEPLPGFPRRGPFEFLVGDILRIPALVKSLLREWLVPARAVARDMISQRRLSTDLAIARLRR
jgi:hypothetical protein